LRGWVRPDVAPTNGKPGTSSAGSTRFAVHDSVESSHGAGRRGSARGTEEGTSEAGAGHTRIGRTECPRSKNSRIRRDASEFEQPAWQRRGVPRRMHWRYSHEARNPERAVVKCRTLLLRALTEPRPLGSGPGRAKLALSIFHAALRSNSIP
jgi:hypothetical protein